MREPIKITEKDMIHETWYKEDENQTLESLPEFLRHLVIDYKHDYGTICHALTAAGIAAMWSLDKSEQGGITGFQAGCIMWSFLQHWTYSENKIGLRIVDYDNLLYPQYKDKFEITLQKELWEKVQEEAKKLISKFDDPDKKMMVSPEVYAHWKSIVDGKIPFGLRMEDTK